jgi:serine/threonine-protein kinase
MDVLIGRTVGPYQIEDLIGEGSTARVYRVQHKMMRRRFALKLFSAEHRGEGVPRQRFTREARVLARIAHPNVVRLTDFDVSEDGRPYLVMEWIEGESLQRAIRRMHGLSPALTIELAKQIARGLSAVHAAGVIHRDLKPGNIMLLTTDEGHAAKLVDFGLVWGQTFAGITAPDAIIGTPHYMPPELITRSPVSERSDLYSFGAILCEMLTGLAPFEGMSMFETLNAHLTEDPPALSDAYGELGALIERLLAKDPEDRPASALEVVEVLESMDDTDFGYDDTQPDSRRATSSIH